MNDIIIVISIIIFYVISVFLARLDAIKESLEFNEKEKLNSHDLFFILFPFVNLGLVFHFIGSILLKNLSKFLNFVISNKFKEWFITIK
jgi:hypothetical protein